MAYLDKIQTASFRNVTFYIDNHSFEGGRRVIQHEFPERNDPFAEDMGRRARTFTLEGHVIGDDYFAIRNRLIRALEKKDDGILIHPYLGRKQVMVSGFTVTESIREGRIAQFVMTFVERGRALNPTGIFGTIFNVINQVNTFIEDVQSEFQEIYDLALLPGYVAESALGVFNNAVDTFNEAIGIVPATLSSIDEIRNGILDFQNTLPTIINDPISLSTSTTEVIDSLTRITNDANDKQKILDFLLDFGDDEETPPFMTDSRAQELKNLNSIRKLIQGVGIAKKMSWFTMQVTEPADITDPEQRDLENNTIFSIDDLQEKRDEIIDQVEEYTNKFDEFESRQSILNVKSQMLQALPRDETTTDLKREQVLTPLETLPALYLVYDRLESIEEEEDFIRRNKIQHPAFVPGGEDYEIVEIV